MRGWKGRQPHRDDFRPVYSPAGFDGELRRTVEELRAGRWLAMRTLLADTGTAWASRTSRTQVLGVVAAGSQLVETWLSEDPYSADAAVMAARVAVERALRAHRERYPQAGEVEKEARQACYAAVERLPADPVPWACLLTLAQLDEAQERPEHRERATEPMLPPGPWGLLRHVDERDRYNREAHHRMLQFLHARAAGGRGSQAPAIDFVRWVSSWAPVGSPLLALPLYAYVEQFRRQSESAFDNVGSGLLQQWAHEPIILDTRSAMRGWFAHTDPAGESVSDLNHLAHALWAGHEHPAAGRVFTVLGRYFTPYPWLHVAEVPDGPEPARTEFLRARSQSLSALG